MNRALPCLLLLAALILPCHGLAAPDPAAPGAATPGQAAPYSAGTDRTAAFEQANRLYEQERYSEAAAAYERILDGRSASPALWFNLGNAWFKAGRPGLAIVNYRRAERLAPRDPDVQANLRFARESVQSSRPAGGRFAAALGRLTFDEWAGMFALALWLACVIFAARQLKPRWRPRLQRVWHGAAAAVLLLGAALAAACYARFGLRQAVVIVPEAIARYGPMDESPSHFALRDGSEVRILALKGDWAEIQDGATRTGWVGVRSLAEP
jgi:tetratricopeptide (TPR) repeat protein